MDEQIRGFSALEERHLEACNTIHQLQSLDLDKVRDIFSESIHNLGANQWEYNKRITWKDQAPKITDRIMSLPIDRISELMQNWESFKSEADKVHNSLLNQRFRDMPKCGNKCAGYFEFKDISVKSSFPKKDLMSMYSETFHSVAPKQGTKFVPRMRVAVDSKTGLPRM